MGRYLSELVPRWVERDDLRVVLFAAASSGAIEALRRPTVELRFLGGVRGTVFEQRLLPRALALDPPDVFFSPAYSCPIRTRVPRVTTVHDLSFFALPGDFPFLEGARRRVLVALSVRASSRVIAVSDFTAREIAARFPDAAPKTKVVRHGATPRSLAAARLSADPPLLLSVGSLFGRRCIPQTLTALRIVAASGRAFRATFVGDNRIHPRLDPGAIARDLGIADRVSFPGYVSEDARRTLLENASVALYLSRYEGFGLPALEALECGIPLVTADRPALGEIFAEAALLADPEDPRSIAGALTRMLDEPDLRGDLARRARSLLDRFSWDTCAERTLETLREAATA